MKKMERTYSTVTAEELTMDKYTQLLKDIATIIADTERENFLLRSELERTKICLAETEEKMTSAIARNAVDMMTRGSGGNA